MFIDVMLVILFFVCGCCHLLAIDKYFKKCCKCNQMKAHWFTLIKGVCHIREVTLNFFLKDIFVELFLKKK